SGKIQRDLVPFVLKYADVRARIVFEVDALVFWRPGGGTRNAVFRPLVICIKRKGQVIQQGEINADILLRNDFGIKKGIRHLSFVYVVATQEPESTGR